MTEPNKLQMLVAEINGTAESEYIGLYKQIPFRVQIRLFARLSALHDLQNRNAKTPRNALLNDLLEIAMDQVISSLDEDTNMALDHLEEQYYENLSQFDSGELNDE
ncbi:hypothetical protein PY247_23665 (plasmid) [Acinetobacter proteolyticus]|nr:hypothetical protein [Acinetobacter proteolyticus]WEI20668.1 hypothetical protein PY247_23690 [Acinetobacter proteolyticus]WEI20673.1 hypothetical protein PY247_23715 [Acinetobacter proteolyticus]WEI20678.1 hypothetical protein PY247_23590 [Acinetobacter proteolyticus]WEI20683.1 hypothetical protein PY247_23615 [Acinetobacter proteolyticus]WEI20688.1 hypothetical protein PY247_23640 [Acinetobacter proteolyticus]